MIAALTLAIRFYPAWTLGMFYGAWWLIGMVAR
jgi:hypothetical protein